MFTKRLKITLASLVLPMAFAACGQGEIVGGTEGSASSGSSSSSSSSGGGSGSSLSYTVQNVTYARNTTISNNTPTTDATQSSYSVAPALPSGLSIDSDTGIISGTPDTNTAAADYVVTLNYGTGTLNSTINITVIDGWVVDSTGDASDFSTGDGFCDTDDSVGDGPCTLRAAAEQAAASGGDRVISIPAGTITMNTSGLGSVTLGSATLTSLELSGQGSSSTTIDGATTAPRIFETSNGTNVRVVGMTLQNGRTTTDGGAINHASTGTLTIENSTITGNAATTAQAGALGGQNSSGTMTIRNSTVSNNTSVTFAGALGTFEAVVIEDSTFSGNSCSGGSCDGGAIWGGDALTISGSTFSSNTSQDEGGAIYHGVNAVMTVTTSTFSSNNADTGGAIRADSDSDLELTDVNFGSNTASGSGGAIYYAGGGGAFTSNLLRVSFYSNSATFGGAMLIGDQLTLNLTNVTASQNTSTASGGAFQINGGTGSSTVTINQSTIANNQADSDMNASGDGGGVSVINGNTVNLVQTALVNNLADATADNCNNSGSTINAANFNLTDTAAADCSLNTGAANADIENSSTHGIATTVADNGGAVQTLAILSTTASTVDYIAAGSCFSVLDARSSSRPTDGNGDMTSACDIGAFEL